MSTEGKDINAQAPVTETGKVEAVAPKKRTVKDIVSSEVRRRSNAKKKIADPNIRLEWYIVQAYANLENRVMQAIKDRIEKEGLNDYFGEVKVPQEEVVELVKGEKHKVNRKFFPGYILVQMHLNDETKHLINNTPKVVGFVGDAHNPMPMSEVEVENLMTQMEEGSTALAGNLSFEVGDTVKVTEGPFIDYMGTIEEVKADKAKLRVLFSIFGRATPVELDFYQVQKQI